MEFDCGRSTIKLASNSKSSVVIGWRKLKEVTDRKRKIHRRVIAVIQSCYEKYVIRNKDFYGSHW